MVRTRPGQRHRGEQGILFQNGLAVFHRKIVIGPIQQSSQPFVRTDGFHRRLPCRCKAARPGGKPAFQLSAIDFAVQHPGGVHQQGSVRRFGPEHQRITPGGRKDAHPGPGKGLCPRAGTGGRKRKYKVCPALQRRLHPHAFRQKGQCPALGQPAAHGHCNMLCAHGTRLRQLPCMAVVKGVVFRNDACKLHRVLLKRAAVPRKDC